jgi:SNF2 family DNA or RNA helicase
LGSAFVADRGGQAEKKIASGAYGAGGNKLGNRVSKPSPFLDWEDDGDGDSHEEENKYREKAVRREVKLEKPQEEEKKKSREKAVRRDADGGAGQEEKENRGKKEEVGWEKTEDFKMEPTGFGVMVKPYKLPGSIFNMLYPHQREGLRWLWVLHCRGTGGILGDDMGLGKTMQVRRILLPVLVSH